jgi:hypothetical protein
LGVTAAGFSAQAASRIITTGEGKLSWADLKSDE